VQSIGSPDFAIGARGRPRLWASGRQLFHNRIGEELPVIQVQSREVPLIGCEGGPFYA